MKLRTLAAVGVLAASATPALADPWMALDASPDMMVMVDRGSIERYGAIRIARSLYVIKDGPPALFTVTYNCDMLTFEEKQQQFVTKALTPGPPVTGKPGTITAAPGSLGAALMANVCQDKLVNASGGWTRPDLKGAIEAATSAGYVHAWP